MISDLKKATPITLASRCILPGIAIMMASEAIAASEVNSDLKFELSGLNNPPSSALALKCLSELPER